MSLEASARLRAAKRAYELGRAIRASMHAAIVAPAIACSIWLRGAEPITLAAGVVLYVLVAGLFFAGRGHARAAWAGLAAGVWPLVLPLVAHACGAGCSLEAHVHGAVVCCASARCMVACVAAGAFAGLVIGGVVPRDARSRHLVAEGALVSVLAGALGCMLMGVAGVAGMAAATVVSIVATKLLAPAPA